MAFQVQHCTLVVEGLSSLYKVRTTSTVVCVYTHKPKHSGLMCDPRGVTLYLFKSVW